MNAFLYVVVPVLLFTACRRNQQEPTKPATSSTADFSRYLAVGNALTAGFSNGGLYRESQLNAYPNLLAQRFQSAGGSAFVQPLFNEDQANGSGYLQQTSGPAVAGFPALGYVSSGTAIRSRNPMLFTKYTGPAPANLGIPNLRLADLNTAGYGSAQGNPFFERLLTSGQEQTTYLDYVKARSTGQNGHTFFTCSIGSDDVMAFVTSGGREAITSTTTFTTHLRQLLDVLTSRQAKGVLSNLPDITTLAYLNTRTVTAMQGPNKVVVYIRTGQGVVRPATADDLILNDADSIGLAGKTGLQKGYFSAYPLHNEDVLDADEVKQARNAVQAFNSIIQAEATARNLPVVDLYGLSGRLKAGLTQNGITLNTTFLTGGFYSLDGTYPTSRGYALIANEYLSVINKAYQSSFRAFELTTFKGE
ncbi:SGNH/GDSL hydrolase family protein [Fibrisoma montanum]|uniref:SGNH/GDSL hydrolase family protein n=1 Tax=Fibrisoma montanum TaxID=2305895 RepID=A0A418MIP9_9BACT|nr:SGNH/GDSL hydrolase family protein [Fibrisoma montanum]RIV27233.1 SGNH/GDSL hydrolase family protein [Fibrisoma montanum]